MFSGPGEMLKVKLYDAPRTQEAARVYTQKIDSSERPNNYEEIHLDMCM